MSYLPPCSSRSLFSIIFSSRWNRKRSDGLQCHFSCSTGEQAPSRVTLQNRWALDLLTAEKGSTCIFLQEECCYYTNESGLVEENINTLHCLQEDLRK
ncbi:provirus ancestral Env polyprotein [Plecturocebus cupreus]